GTKAIAYCSSVKAAYATAEEFRRHGYRAEALDGTSKKDVRLETMERFRRGEIDVLLNNSLFGEGLDISDCETILLLKKTKSLTLYIQMAMRGMRTDKNNPQKVSKIIDYCGNVYEHGFVDDNRIYTLDGRTKNEQSEIKIKMCPSCYGTLEQNVLICPYCEFSFEKEVRERQEQERVQAELKEVERLETETLKQMNYNEYRNLDSWVDMWKFAQARNYKIVWAVHKCLELDIEIPPRYWKVKELVLNKK
ncbi:MAG: DEAD/DEAH box helicase, partial [Alphaproteobacteria bacterium]